MDREIAEIDRHGATETWVGHGQAMGVGVGEAGRRVWMGAGANCDSRGRGWGGRSPRSIGRGIAETLAIVAFFVVAGLLSGAVAGGSRGAADPAPSHYLPDAMDRALPEPRIWLVDGFNTLHVALLRGRERGAWWTREGREQLLARVRRFDDPAAEVWVVFDGPHPLSAGEQSPPAPGPRVAFARSADEWMLGRLGEVAAGEAAVVTSDRPLADKARARGAWVVSPHEFLARCAGAGAARS